MKVFISWSGVDSTSHKVAEALSTWLPLVFDNIECFFSSADIGPGTVWMQSLFKQLEDSQFGIICVTGRLMNRASPWMFFETGALAKEMLRQSGRSRVIPLMIGISATQLVPPLSAFQGLSADKDGIWELIETLGTAGGPSADILDRRFRALWPTLKADIEGAIVADSGPAEKVPKRTTDDILVNVLDQLKALETRVADLSSQIASVASPSPPVAAPPVTVTVGQPSQAAPVTRDESVGEK